MVQEFFIVATFHLTQPSSCQALLVSGSSYLPLSIPAISTPLVLFVVVNSALSVGNLIMVGSGEIDQQDILPPAPLPAPFIAEGSVLPAAGEHRKQASFAHLMKPETGWHSVLTWTFGARFWLFLF